MAILRANEIDRFITKIPDEIAGVLIYGPNEGRINQLSTEIVKSVIGSLDDPFNLVMLNEGQLKESRGLLRDEMLALSFTGDRKVIWIKEPGPAFTRQISGLFEEDSAGNLLVVQTGQLKKTATLRKYFEQSKQATSIACYEDTLRDLTGLIIQKAKSDGKEINAATINFLVETVGTDRSLLLSELEKLLNFCANTIEITISDVEALSGDPLYGNMDELCDLTLTGDVKASTSRFHHLTASGIAAAQILNLLSIHLARLQKFRIDIDKGQSAEIAVKSARPPIFFKRQPTVKRQLLIWQSIALKKANSIVFEAIVLTRKNADLAESICERALITLGKMAQSASR